MGGLGGDDVAGGPHLPPPHWQPAPDPGRAGPGTDSMKILQAQISSLKRQCQKIFQSFGFWVSISTIFFLL